MTSLRQTETTSTTERALPSVTVTDRDLERLTRCIEQYSDGRLAEQAEALEIELTRAHVVSAAELPRGVVTMGSRLVVEDVRNGGRRAITLVYPEEADSDTGKVSVLAPMGSAVLGLRVGDEIDWDLPGGRTARFRIVEVSFQP
jgi:regulator of nucleoside diphosphate kinase